MIEREDVYHIQLEVESFHCLNPRSGAPATERKLLWIVRDEAAWIIDIFYERFIWNEWIHLNLTKWFHWNLVRELLVVTTSTNLTEFIELKITQIGKKNDFEILTWWELIGRAARITIQLTVSRNGSVVSDPSYIQNSLVFSAIGKNDWKSNEHSLHSLPL